MNVESSSNPSAMRLTVNGTLHHIPNPDPSMVLSTYIRDVLLLKGVKVCCGSGRCGTCTVLFCPRSQNGTESCAEGPMVRGPPLVPINACLRLLISCDGGIVVTPEGLGTSKAGFHAIQRALADGNGVQCGFCSPGFTLTAMGYWLEKYESNDYFNDRDDAVKLGLEEYLAGNLCRCTGYRPILESLAGLLVEQKQNRHQRGSNEDKFVPYDRWGMGDTPDVEDAHFVRCRQQGNSRVECKSGLKCEFQKAASADNDVPLSAYYRPTSLEDLQNIYQSLRKQHNVPTSSIQIIAANTSSGLRSAALTRPSPSNLLNRDRFTCKIDINSIEELRECTLVDANEQTSSLVVGALTTLSSLINLLRSHSTTASQSSASNSNRDQTWEAAADHLNSIGNTQVRAVATWSGNLMFSLRHRTYVSDVVLVLLALNARVTFIDLLTGMKKEKIPLDLFIKKFTSDDLSSTLFLSVHIAKHANLRLTLPSSVPSAKRTEILSEAQVVAQSYRVSSRQRNSHGHVSCCISAYIHIPTPSKRKMFLGRDSRSKPLRHVNISPTMSCLDARIIISGVTSSVLHAKQCAAAIVRGSSFDDQRLQSSLDALDRDIANAGGVTEWGGTSTLFRLSVARGLIYKFFLYLQGYISGIPAPSAFCLARQVPVKSRYTYVTYEDKFPVSYPIQNLDSRLLASGEVKYTLDQDLPTNGLYGALIIAARAGVVFESLDSKGALEMEGIVDVLTAQDIPARNSVVKGFPTSEEEDECLFLEQGKIIPCVGTCLGVVVGKTRHQAERASRRVRVDYADANDGSDSVFSLTAAMEANSIFETPNVETLSRGNVDSGLDQSPLRIGGTVSSGGQKHFYLENQNTIAIPLEGGRMTVRSGTQSITLTQTVISNVLGLPSNRINVITRRVGGAFGGKITRSLHCAAAAAVAAAHLNCPIHVANARDTDQCMVGGREPLVVEYEVGHDSTGRILALSLKLHMDGGCTKDESESDLILALRWCEHCYYISDFRATGALYRTNLPSNTACRAPGSVQACYAVDTIMYRVAKACSMTLHQCQEINFCKEGQTTLTGDVLRDMNLPRVWLTLKDDAKIEEKRAEIEAFNIKNKWRKRGLGATPCRYGLVGSWFKEMAKVCIFASDGSVEISHSGVEMGQGVDTKVAQSASMALGIPIDWIVIGEKSSNSQPNTAGTNASATSELCCAAVLEACSIINQRLDPYKKSLQEAHELCEPELFLKAVQAADRDRICLTCEGWAAPQIPHGSTYLYHVYCAAATVVELDILTGAIEICNADITYDCGNQLNASIDVGQIEGGFVIGLGYFLTEKVTFDGKLPSRNTLEYEPFGTTDVPTEFNIRLLKSDNTANGAVLRSKATGEPPLICASSAHFAVREAIAAFRKESGNEEEFDLEVPATVEQRHLACLVQREQYKLL